MMTESATRGADPVSTGVDDVDQTPAGKPSKRTGRGRQPRLLGGQPATSRHFLIDVDVLNAAETRAASRGVPLSEVARAGIDDYVAGTPEEAQRIEPGEWLIMPQAVIDTLRELWSGGDRDRQNAYLKAVRDRGYSYRAIASGMVAGGIVEKISRQAIFDRCSKAPDEYPEDLPTVSEAAIARAKGYSTANTFDYSFRLTDEAYRLANRRADYEGSVISAVVENILRRYAAGDFEYPATPVA